MCAVQLNGCEIRKGRKVGVTISHNNHRLFVGNIPKNRDRPQLYEDFAKYARKSTKTKKNDQTQTMIAKFALEILLSTDPVKPFTISFFFFAFF
jgi:RNA recognition motif-containing protein